MSMSAVVRLIATRPADHELPFDTVARAQAETPDERIGLDHPGR